MMSAESTVTLLSNPDTVRLVQWPLMTTVLDTPLTLTMLSLQVIVLCSLTPTTLRLLPAGGLGVAGASAVGVWVRLPRGGGLCGTLIAEVVGDSVANVWEMWRAA